MLAPGDERLAGCFAELGEGERSVDLRYAGQGYELNVPWGGDFVRRFHEAHRQRYGYADEKRPVEVVNARVRIVSASSPSEEEAEPRRTGDGEQAVTQHKEIYCEGGWRKSKVYARERLEPGDVFSGPAVVVEYSATTYIEPGAQVAVDGFRNLTITL
jgi:N-methylhydantoinase A